mmetsp:Transcript_7759/g.23274  ORF Transcript_7759/g.23274 Transcript_7759/m.23274 type:complete len:233 (-) Transcript_7759:372-1070(-)
MAFTSTATRPRAPPRSSLGCKTPCSPPRGCWCCSTLRTSCARRRRAIGGASPSRPRAASSLRARGTSPPRCGSSWSRSSRRAHAAQHGRWSASRRRGSCRVSRRQSARQSRTRSSWPRSTAACRPSRVLAPPRTCAAAGRRRCTSPRSLRGSFMSCGDSAASARASTRIRSAVRRRSASPKASRAPSFTLRTTAGTSSRRRVRCGRRILVSPHGAAPSPPCRSPPRRRSLPR